jgi:hemolysin III
MENPGRLTLADCLVRSPGVDGESRSSRAPSAVVEREIEQLDGHVPVYTRGEEIAHWLTHGIGAVLSVFGLTVLVAVATARGDGWYQASFAIFGLALCATYTVSTSYHLCRGSRRRWLLRRLDHAAIFVLIAATYTPFLVTALRGSLGWGLLIVIWTLCGAGAVGKLFGLRCGRVTSTCIYLGLSWLIVIAAKPMLAAVPLAAIGMLLAGGVAYTAGVAFYLRHSLRYHHAIWHGFVLAGSACHFVAVLLLVQR